MTDELDIHAASHDELLAAHHNVFDVWSKGLSLDDHVRYRLNSPTHRSAQWFVGCRQGRVVTSLACHQVRFRLLGDDLPGMAIGSVHTVALARGRGYAPRLIAWVEQHKLRENTAASVLYSDIKPDYYARQGYVLCPSYEGWRDVSADDADLASTYRLSRFSAGEHLSTVKRLYADYHGAAPLSIARDDDYWAMMLEKHARDPFYALVAADQSWAGYVLVGMREDGWHIVDYALVDQTDAALERLYAAFLAAARRAGARRAGGWLPQAAAARKFFSLVPRRTEITMIKPLAWCGTLSDQMIAPTSRFCELDHV